MIYTCLPSGNMHGWGIAGNYIRRELSKLTECVDISDIKVMTVLDAPVLMAIAGVEGMPMNPNVMTTAKMIGYGFCEEPSEAARYIDNWNKYDVVVCGSTWMSGELVKIGVLNTAVALQGVDYEIFKPSEYRPKKSPFVIFSGGKFEYRKGQDIVIAAIAKLMAKHDIRLIAAWMNFWPSTMRTMEKSEYIKYQHVSDDWSEQVTATLIANGVPIEKVMMPDVMDNSLMVELYQSAHIGVFPNRVEAGTNLVMCEAIASGLPCLASRATGQADIVEPCGQFYLLDEDPVYSICSGIEFAMKHIPRTDGAEKIRGLISWPRCASQLLAILED